MEKKNFTREELNNFCEEFFKKTINSMPPPFLEYIEDDSPHKMLLSIQGSVYELWNSLVNYENNIHDVKHKRGTVNKKLVEIVEDFSFEVANSAMLLAFKLKNDELP